VLEDIASFYSLVCFFFFFVHSIAVPKMRDSDSMPIFYACVSLLLCVCWIYILFVNKSLQTIFYPIQSTGMLVSIFPYFILTMKTLNWSFLVEDEEKKDTIAHDETTSLLKNQVAQ
jgi:hypothetical protein